MAKARGEPEAVGVRPEDEIGADGLPRGNAALEKVHHLSDPTTWNKKVVKAEKIKNPHRKAYDQAFVTKALDRLDENLGNVSRTAKEFGVEMVTLRRWAINAGKRRLTVVEASVQQGQKSATYKMSLADAFERIAFKLLKQVMRSNLREVSVPDLVRGATMAAEKMKLLRGEATTITGNQPLGHMTDADLDAQSKKVEMRLRNILQNLPAAERERVEELTRHELKLRGEVIDAAPELEAGD